MPVDRESRCAFGIHWDCDFPGAIGAKCQAFPVRRDRTGSDSVRRENE
jgi:hypothetical protein